MIQFLHLSPLSPRVTICSLWEKIGSIPENNTAFVIHGDENKEVSYKELKTKTQKVASFLANRHSEKERVGILVRNSAEGVMMVLGAYLAGMTSVVLDIEKTPINRIEMIFNDANVHTVLVLDKDDIIVLSLSDNFSIFSWKEAMIEDEIDEHRIYLHGEDHPFSIFYTR